MRYDAHAELPREIARRLTETFEYLQIKLTQFLDLGSGTGYVTECIKKYHPVAKVIALDWSLPTLHTMRATQERICARAQAIPLASGQIDCVISSLMLPWCEDPAEVFQEVYRVLKPGGLWLFSTFGPSTLQTLASSWKQVDSEAHFWALPDMHDLGDMLRVIGFQETVMHCEELILMHRHINALCRELKWLGMQNPLADRRNALTGKTRWAAFVAAHETHRNPEDELPASFEVVYGQCWKPTTQAQSSSEIRISVDDIEFLGDPPLNIRNEWQ